MPRFVVTYEDTAGSKLGPEHDPIEPELSSEELRGANDTRIAEGLFPAGVLRIAKAYATPDDSVYPNGRDDGDVKLFVSIDLIVEAEDEDAIENGDVPERLLNEIAEAIGAHLALEGNWEVLSSESVQVVQSIDDPTAFWSNDHGWGDLAGATPFASSEIGTLSLPVGGRWAAEDSLAVEAPAP